MLDLVPSSPFMVSERISRAIDNWVNKKAKLIDIVSA
jgi:hypothetical protein